jgi:hypothetical protein
MPKTPAPPSRRDVLAGLDPVALVEILDTHFDDDGSRSTYRRLYRDAKAAILAHDAQAVHVAALLEQVDAAVDVEAAIRQAGFVQGFEICRQLLLGELDLAALKGGA